MHYSGRNAVFLPPDMVLPLVSNCLGDARHYVLKSHGYTQERDRMTGPEVSRLGLHTRPFCRARSAKQSEIKGRNQQHEESPRITKPPRFG